MSAPRLLRKIWNTAPSLWWQKAAAFAAKAEPDKSLSSEKSVWCLSTGRVGSQTIAALGGLGSNINANHEPKPLLYGLSRLGYELGGNESSSAVFQEAIRTTRVDQYTKNGVYLETSPQVTFLIEHISSLLPESRFIHIVRSPSSVIRSGMRRDWYSGNTNDLWRIRPKSAEEQKDWESYSVFQKNVWLWAETNRWILDKMKSLDSERALVIRAEEIFAGDENALSEFYEFLGCGLPSKDKIEQVLGMKLNSQKVGKFPEFDGWKSEERTFLSEIAGDVIEELGYKS